MDRTNPTGVRSKTSGRGFLFLLQTLRGATRSICCKRKEKVARSSGGARRAGSEGERGRGKAHKPGSKSGSQAAIRAGLDKTGIGGGAGHDPRGGRSRYILTGPPPPLGVGRDVRKGGRSRSVSRPTPSRGGAGQSISRPAPRISRPAPPRSDNFI